MSQIRSAAYSINWPRDMVILIELNQQYRRYFVTGGILIDAYQAAMVGFNRIAAIRHFASLAKPSKPSIAALIGVYCRQVINRAGKSRHLLLAGGCCTIGAATVMCSISVVLVYPRHHGLWFRHRFLCMCRGRGSLVVNVEETGVRSPLANGLVFRQPCLF